MMIFQRGDLHVPPAYLVTMQLSRVIINLDYLPAEAWNYSTTDAPLFQPRCLPTPTPV